VTGRWEVVDISPDGQWLAIRNYAFGLAIVHLDGSAVYDEVAPSAAIPRWLSDGTVLVVHMDYTASGQPHYKSVVRFDPAAGQTADLEIDLEALDADPTLLDTALADMGLSYAETTDADPGPIYYAQEAEDDASPSPICERWQIVSINWWCMKRPIPAKSPICVCRRMAACCLRSGLFPTAIRSKRLLPV
jgi:hypothetical protein